MMRNYLKSEALGFRIKRAMWFRAVSLIHGAFDSVVSRRAPLKPCKALMICIYRQKNGGVLSRCVDEAVQLGWHVRLWALDAIYPDLARYSRGVGTGSRSPLLNALVAGTDLAEFDWVIIIDDDFEFERGSFASLLAIADAAGIALAQPSRAYGRYRTFRIINCDPLSIARLTTYVEIGPVIAVSRAWVRRILPFPDGYGMGWGLDLLWSELRKEGLRLGVIDWVTIKHLSPVGKTYDNSPEKQRLVRMLQERGLNSIEEMQTSVAAWRPWERHPNWLR
jgi:hypothetical protein